MKSVSNSSVKVKTIKVLGMATTLLAIVASVMYIMDYPLTTSSGLRLWKVTPDDTVTDSDQTLDSNELHTVPLDVGKRKVRKHTSYDYASSIYE